MTRTEQIEILIERNTKRLEGYRVEIKRRRIDDLPYFTTELVFNFQAMDALNKIYELQLKYSETLTIINMLKDLLKYDEGGMINDSERHHKAGYIEGFYDAMKRFENK